MTEQETGPTKFVRVVLESYWTGAEITFNRKVPAALTNAEIDNHLKEVYADRPYMVTRWRHLPDWTAALSTT